MNELKLVVVYLLILIGSSFLSCKQTEETKPEVLLTESQMIDVTTDIQLIEAALNYRRNIGLDFTDIRDVYYGHLFEKHGITAEIYQENVLFYNRTPARMESIYNEVLENLEALQAGLGDLTE
mgnify:CR=1 FL=1